MRAASIRPRRVAAASGAPSAIAVDDRSTSANGRRRARAAQSRPFRIHRSHGGFTRSRGTSVNALTSAQAARSPASTMNALGRVEVRAVRRAHRCLGFVDCGRCRCRAADRSTRRRNRQCRSRSSRLELHTGHPSSPSTHEAAVHLRECGDQPAVLVLARAAQQVDQLDVHRAVSATRERPQLVDVDVRRAA